MRELEAADIPSAVDLIIAAGLFGAEDAGLLRNSLADHFRVGSASESAYLVETEDDRIVAIAQWQPKPATDGTWDLTMLAVGPDRHRSGYGSRLLSEVERRLRAQEQRLLVIETSSTAAFSSARRFYLRHDYTPSAEVADYWEDGDGLVVFSKRLTR